MWSGSFVALVTPFKENRSLDLEAFESLIKWHIEMGTEGFVLLGSTAEAALLDQDEKQRLLQSAFSIDRGDIPMVVGVSHPSTKVSVKESEQAFSLGADACMATPPYYVKPTERGCVAHFSALSAIGGPLMIYNHPGRTGINLSSDLLEKLGRLPHVVAIKESGGGSALCGEIPVFCGDDPLAHQMLLAGSAGSISVIANAFPREWSAFVRASLEGKGDASYLQGLLGAMNCDSNPVPIKYIMHKMGLCKAAVRLPLLELEESSKAHIDAALNEVVQAF